MTFRPPHLRVLRASVVFLFLSFAAWPYLFVQGRVPIDTNLFTLLFPNWALFQHGAILWNPLRDLGSPFLADPQSLAGYPIRWLLKPFDFLNYLRLWTLIHSAIAFYFTRRLCRQWGYGETASLAAGVLATFNGFFAARLSLVNHFAAAAYLPVVLYFQAIRSATGLGAALALQWLAGFPPFFLLTVLTSAAVELIKQKRSIRLWLQGLVWAGGLCAFQWLPFLDLLQHSVRGVAASASAAGQFSEPPRQLLKMLLVPQWSYWLPGLIGDQAVTAFYLGPIALVLAGVALRSNSKRSYTLAGAALVAGALSLGQVLPFFAQLRPLHIFRFPANWLLITSFALALLAAAGLHAIKNPKLRVGLLVLLSIDLVCFLREPKIAWFDPSFLWAAPPAVTALPHGTRIYHQESILNEFERSSLRSPADYLRMKNFLQPSYGSVFGLRGVNSTQVLKLKSVAHFQERLNNEGPQSTLLREASVSAVVVKTAPDAPLDEAHLRLVQLTGGIPLGRSVKPLESQELVSGPTRHLWRLDSPTNNEWIWGEVNDGNWKAWLDGKPVPVGLASELFCKIEIPAGKHELQLDYAPKTFRIGSLVTLAFLVAWLFKIATFCL